MATYGEGDATDNSNDLYEWLQEGSMEMHGIKFAVSVVCAFDSIFNISISIFLYLSSFFIFACVDDPVQDSIRYFSSCQSKKY